MPAVCTIHQHMMAYGREITYLCGEELGENVGQDTTLGDDDGTEELVEFFVVSDGKLKVTRDDT